jgi:hypothetical protein
MPRILTIYNIVLRNAVIIIPNKMYFVWNNKYPKDKCKRYILNEVMSWWYGSYESGLLIACIIIIIEKNSCLSSHPTNDVPQGMWVEKIKTNI